MVFLISSIIVGSGRDIIYFLCFFLRGLLGLGMRLVFSSFCVWVFVRCFI